MTLHGFKVRLKGLHHLHRLRVVNGIHSYGSFCHVHMCMGCCAQFTIGRFCIRLVAGFLGLADFGSSGSGPFHAHKRVLCSIDFLSTTGNVLRYTDLRESRCGQFLTEDSIGKHWAHLLSLSHDFHVLDAIHRSPCRLAEVVHRACENDVERFHKSIWCWRKFQGWHVGRRLCKKDGVPCERLFLHSGVAVSAQADLLRTKSAQGCQHLGRLRCFADMLALAPNPIIIGACVDWHLGLFRSNVNEAIPTCEDTTVLVTNADARWTGVCRLLRPCCA